MVVFRQRNMTCAKSNALNRGCGLYHQIHKTLFAGGKQTYTSSTRLIVAQLFGHKASLSISGPFFSPAIPPPLRLCRRTKLKIPVVSASFFVVFQLIIQVFTMSSSVYEFSATQSCVEPFHHTALVRNILQIFPYHHMNR